MSRAREATAARRWPWSASTTPAWPTPACAACGSAAYRLVVRQRVHRVQQQRLHTGMALSPCACHVIQHGVEEGLRLTRTCARDHQRGIRSALPVLVAAAQPAERLRLVVVRRQPRRQPVQDPVPPGRTRVGEPHPNVQPVEHTPFRVLQNRFQHVGCLRVRQRERGGQLLGNTAKDVLGCVDGDEVRHG